MSELREVKVTCPCCESVLWVDVRTSRVMKHRKAVELDDLGKPKATTSWEEAADRVSGRMGTAKDKFDAGLDREKSRTTDLDDLFKKAAERLKGNRDEE